MSVLAAPRSQTLTAILCAVGASVAFSVNDMAIKSLSGAYALHQVILIRSGVGMLFMLLAVLPFHGGLGAIRTRRPAAQILRGMCVVASNLFYFVGLAALTLAYTSAVFFVAPLLLTALSVVILREKVGPRRWAAVGVGFAGVLVMLDPTGGLHWASLLPLLSALAYALMHLMTRHLKETESAFALTFYTQACFIAVSLCMGLTFGDGHLAGSSDPSLAFLFRDWIWPPADDWPVLLATGLGSAIGGLLIAQAYRLGEAGLIAPFEYVAVPMAIFWSITVFHDWPEPRQWLGITLICGAGLYVGWRETVAARGKRT